MIDINSSNKELGDIYHIYTTKPLLIIHFVISWKGKLKVNKGAWGRHFMYTRYFPPNHTREALFFSYNKMLEKVITDSTFSVFCGKCFCGLPFNDNFTKATVYITMNLKAQNNNFFVCLKSPLDKTRFLLFF